MKPNIVILLAIVISGCFSLSAHPRENDSAFSRQTLSDSITVCGCFSNIADGMPRTAVINECDPSEKSVRAICELNSNGSFCQKIPFSYSHTFTINYNRRNFINAFAAPGDSIYLDIDASTSPLSVSFSGDHAEINQQYDPAFQYLSSILNSSVILPSDTVSLEEYMPVFKEYVRIGRDSIDSYSRKHNLSEEVISMIYTDYIYTLGNFALGYRGRNMGDKRAFFLDPIFDIFNEENTKVMMFPYHIKAIMSHFPEVRETAPNGCVRDIMYACEEDESIPDRSVFFNQKYYNRLYANDVPVKEISIDAIKPGNCCVYIDGEIKEISDENPLRWLLNEYERYPVYLDVSATWCGPCRTALKDSELVRKHFKESDIKFVIIWLRSDKKTWLKIAPTITNAVQIFIDSTEMDDRIQHYLDVRGFPTYLMIERQGNIIKDGVPRYLSPELLNFLSNYL